MTTFDVIGIAGCILAAVHASLSFPVIVKTANGRAGLEKLSNINLLSGLLMYTCWLIYAYASANYLLAFAQVLGVLKYGVVLIQLGLKNKPELNG